MTSDCCTSTTLTYDGNTLTGTGTDNGPALSDLAATNPARVCIPGAYDTPTTGALLIATQVPIPTREYWLGYGGRTKFVIDVNDPYPNGYLLFGATTAYQSAQSYDLFGCKEFGGVYLDGRAAAGNGKSPVGVVVGMPGATVRDVYAYSMQTTVRGAETGGATGVDPHSDHLVISNVHTNNQPNPVDFDWNSPTSARYAIDYLRTQAGADGAVIERCQANPTGTVPTQKRARHIGLRAFTCGVVQRVLNGDVYFYQSKATLRDSYFEHGQTTVLDSETVIENVMFWQRSEASRGADIGCVPLRLIAATGLESPSANPTSAVVRDCVWNYDAVGQVSGAGLGGYSLTNPNFTIDTSLYALVQIENCWRGAPYSNGRGWYPRLGLTCGMAEFDTYSHFASLASRYEASGTSGGNRWRIEARRGPIAIGSASTANVIETVTDAGSGFKTTWQEASATYYYRAAVYHDKVRSIGILGAQELSIARTNGGGGSDIRLGYDLPGGGYMLRLYRGTATGAYDHYVDVPVLLAGRLYDNGFDVGGFPWLTRTTGPADAVNGGLSGGIDLSPAERTAASDAYGKMIATSLTGAVPTVGAWRRGDEVRLIAPTLSGTRRLVAYRRLTNCTSAAPTHVLGTDWEAVYSTVPAADGQFAANGTNVTLAAGVKRVSVSSTTANVVVSNVADNEVEGYTFLLDIRTAATGNTVKVNKSTGSTVITLCVPGLYMVSYRGDTATWVALRVGDTPLSGTLDEGSSHFEQYVSGVSTVTVDANAKLINVSSASSTVAITMPASIEFNGTTRRLLVRGYTNAITVAKSSGTISSSGVIIQTGLYELVFTQGVWLATRLGNIPA